MKQSSKRLFAVTLTALMLLSLAACGQEPSGSGAPDGSGAPQTIVIRVNSAMKSSTVEETANGLAILAFCENVRERTDGRYEIKLFMDSQLGGSTEQVVGGMQSGAFEMCTLALGSFGEYTTAFMPMNFPYLFSSADVVHDVVDGPVGRRMREQCLADTGIRVLAFTELGYRHITNNKRPIQTPADMKGLKLRTMNDNYQIAAMEALGAAVTPISYSELFTALQQGLVDAQENPCQNIWTEKFYEVQKYMSLTRHSYTLQMLGMSETFFQGLPEDVQQILIEEGRNVELANRSKLEEIDQAQLEELKKVMEVYELSTEEFEAFREVASSSWTDAAAAMGEEAYQELLDAVSASEAAHSR